MKKIFILILSTTPLFSSNDIQLSVSGAQQSTMPITIVTLDKTNKELTHIASIIAKDLQFTEQFTVTTKNIDAFLSKKELLKNIKDSSRQHGIPLALCINAPNKNTIEWRLYETMEGSMITGKKYIKQGNKQRIWAHAIADKVWQALTGNAGFFSSRITYCTEQKNTDGSLHHQICIADFDGSNPEVAIDASNILVAPRWNTSSQKPSLYYSHYTKTNVQLLSCTFDTKKPGIKQTKIASNFDGVNMLPGFSADGKAIAYCASRGGGNCQLYYCKKGSVKQFTKNDGNNVSPVFIDNERICFCSDVHTGNPQIYIGNLKTGHVQRITTGGYCTSPSYCSINNTIAYHKMVDGFMQIYIYDLATKTHTQITKSATNKHDASWSPDGTYLLFAQESNKNKDSRLVALNMLTKKPRLVTDTHKKCTYPHWSPIYKYFPILN